MTSLTSFPSTYPGDKPLENGVYARWTTSSCPQRFFEFPKSPICLWTPVDRTVDKVLRSDQRKQQFIHNPQDLLPLPTFTSSEGTKER